MSECLAPAGTPGNPTVYTAGPPDKTYDGGGSHCRVNIQHQHHVWWVFIITNFNQGLFVENSQNIIVEGNTVHHVGQEGIHVLLNSSFVTVQNNTVHDTRQWQYNGEGIYVGSGSTAPTDNTHHVTILNNTVYNTADEAIEVQVRYMRQYRGWNTIYNALTNRLMGGESNKVGSIEVDEHSNGNQFWDPTRAISYATTSSTIAGRACEPGPAARSTTT